MAAANKAFTFEPFGDAMERVTCPYCNFIWIEDKPIKSKLRCPACKWSTETQRPIPE